MKPIIQAIGPIQILFQPLFVFFALFLLYRMIKNDDKPAGLVLYIGLVIIVDSYMQKGIFLPGVEKGSIKYSEIMWLILFVKDRKAGFKFDLRFSKIMFCFFLLYFFFLLIAAFNGATIQNGIFNFRRLIFPQLLAFYIALSGFEKEEDYNLFFKYLIIVVLIVTLFGFWQAFANRIIIRSDVLRKAQYYHAASRGRFGSLFGNPNYLGNFIILLLPVFFSMFIVEQRKKKIYLLTILVLIFMLSKTGSRGPLLSLAVTMPFFIYALRKRAKKIIWTFSVIALLFVVFMPGVYETATRRFHSEGGIDEEMQADTVSRGFIWKITMQIINDYPFGIGLGETKFYEMSLLNEYSMGTHHGLDNPHNSLLEIWVMGGTQTFVCFLVILVAFLLKGYFYFTKKGDNEIFVGIYFGLLGFIVAMNSEPIMFKTSVSCLFWVLLGLGMSYMKFPYQPTVKTSRG